jgi:hypothetical protein
MSKSISQVKLALSTTLFAVLATVTSAAQIGVSPSTLSYRQEMFTTSEPKSLLVTNSGVAAITFGPTSISGTDAGDFAIATDSCANHTIAPLKRCQITLAFSATQAVGSTESATLSVNDSLGTNLQEVALSGVVLRAGLRATISGLIVSIINPTNNQASADWSVNGPYTVDDVQTTCVDIIFPKSTCVIVLARTGPPNPGSIDIQVVPQGPGHTLIFNVPLN